MKNHTCLLLLLAFVSVHTNAQTIIEDSTEVSGTWTEAGSPYLINGLAIIHSK